MDKKLILFGFQITVIGGFVSINPAYNHITIGYILIFLGLIISVLGLIKTK